MKLDPDASIIVLSAEVFGPTERRVVRVVFDTGATYVVISTGVAEGIGLDPASADSWVRITTASGVESVPLITIPKMEALGVELNNVEAVCLDLPETSNVDGLLGLSFLKRFDIELFFKRGFLNLK